MTPQPGATVTAVARALGEKKEEEATESAPAHVDGSAGQNGKAAGGDDAAYDEDDEGEE